MPQNSQEMLIGKLPPRVLVVGPIFGGAIETARSTARACEAAGAETQFLDFATFGAGWGFISQLSVPDPEKIRLQAEYAKVLGEVVMESARVWRPDLVLALPQGPLNGSVCARLRAAGVKVALWFVENYRVLPYWKSVAKDYDFVFAIQDEPFLSMLREAGAAKAVYLPTACDPERHVPLALTDAERRHFGADVSFAGAPYLNRQRLLLGLLDLHPKLWGEGWASTDLRELSADRGTWFNLEKMIRIFAATKINLNIHSANHVEGLDPDPDYVNPRTFELAACQAFQLVDARLPLPALFSTDEMVTFRSVSELRSLISYYLAHPEERAAIAERARAKALAEHSFVHRVRRIFEETLPADRQPPAVDADSARRKDSPPAHTLADAILGLERTSPKMTPDEAMMRVLQHVRDGAL